METPHGVDCTTGLTCCRRVMDWWKTRKFLKEVAEMQGKKSESDLESSGILTRWQDDLDMVPYNEEMGLFFEYLEMGSFAYIRENNTEKERECARYLPLR